MRSIVATASILVVVGSAIPADAQYPPKWGKQPRGVEKFDPKSAQMEQAERELVLALSRSGRLATTRQKNRDYIEVPEDLKFGELTLVSPDKFLDPELRFMSYFVDIAIGTKNGRLLYVKALANTNWWLDGREGVPDEIAHLRSAIAKADPSILMCNEGDCDNYCTKDGKRQCCDVGCSKSKPLRLE